MPCGAPTSWLRATSSIAISAAFASSFKTTTGIPGSLPRSRVRAIALSPSSQMRAGTPAQVRQRPIKLLYRRGRQASRMTDVAAAPAGAPWALERLPNRKIRLGIVGCGDVAFRRYLPALSEHKSVAEVVACCDPQPGAAERAADAVEDWSGAQAYTDLETMLTEADLDAAINLTPATLHGSITQACLEADAHVYSEKPIASTVAEADRLIQAASDRGVLLLCAPATAATRRFKWLGEIVASHRYGRLTLAVAHHADPGPAAWREYNGDPTAFYGPGVGPVVDHGIYRLHGMTALMGPVRRVQAMGAIGKPERVVR